MNKNKSLHYNQNFSKFNKLMNLVKRIIYNISLSLSFIPFEKIMLYNTLYPEHDILQIEHLENSLRFLFEYKREVIITYFILFSPLYLKNFPFH